MNIKQIQALEFIISRMNHDKRLVVEYKEQLLSIDFLAYEVFDGDDEIYAITNETKKDSFLEYSESSNYWASYIFYEGVGEDNFGQSFVTLGPKKYTIGNHQILDALAFKNAVEYIQNNSKGAEYRLKKQVDVTPRNVEFIGTNVKLPFYIFPEDADFKPVSLVDRKIQKAKARF